MSSSKNPYRLSTIIEPRAYRIFITPDMDAFTFKGRVEVDVTVREATTQLTLHAADMTLDLASVRCGDVTLRASDVSFDETYETATFSFDDELPPGEAVVEIAYQGVIADSLAGFYRSTYTDDEGTTHVIGTTQFQHSDARRAFPCWDEPAMKATFQVNLTIPSQLSAYSNSPVSSDVDLGNGQRSVSYAPTMKMSTYLVAWVIGPFEESDTIDVDGVPLRVVTPKGKSHLAKVALDAGAFCLRWFGEYFGIAYPGDKLDMIAVPDFAHGAMENLGCITYRETALLVDPVTSSQAERYRVVEVVHHEIAHQWFGNLVTMEWWEGAWLNEAFATFMQLVCSDAYRPEWRVWVGQNFFRDMALQIDGLSSTRAIEFEVISPDEVQGMFDLLTYEKGASTLRMLEQYLGAATFREGMRHYIATHQYANATTNDLWDALEEKSGQPVRELMNTWIYQGGHPLVTFADATLSQEPFSYLPHSADSKIGESWLAPVVTRSLAGGEATGHLLGKETIAITSPAPVIANAGGWGCFRTRYGTDELAALSTRLDELDELERATLVDDSWATLLAGKSTWEQFLLVISHLGNNDEPTAWEAVTGALEMIRRPLSTEQRQRLVETVRPIYAAQFARLGWDALDAESDLTPRMRSTIIRGLGSLCGDEDIQREAVARFEAGELNGDLAVTILRIVAQQDRPGDYEKYLEGYRTAPNPQEQMRYLGTLAAFSDHDTALDAARRCFEEFRTQDGPLILPSLTTNPTTGAAVWRVLAERWDEATKKFPTSQLARLATGISTFITDPAFAEEVIAFHQAHPVPGGYPATVPQSIERLRVGLRFADAIRTQI